MLYSKSILSFAVGHLGVGDIIVLGHYECGGVGAAMNSPPTSTESEPISAGDITIHEYISPIRKIYQTSERCVAINVDHRWSPRIIDHDHVFRSEIASARGAGRTESHDPDYCDITRSSNKVTRLAARALVEENVKAQVSQIATSELVKQVCRPKNCVCNVHLTFSVQKFASANSADLYIHGLVYELETGSVYDLGVSVGPQGASPRTPFPPVPTNA